MSPLLSVIILSYNTNELLRGCLVSVMNSTGFAPGELELIVVDNHSADGSAEMVRNDFTQVKLINSRTNVGYSAGNNIGITAARGKYILLLNSDTLVEAGTLRTMVDVAGSLRNLGALTCRVQLPNGQLDPACHRGFPTPWNAFTYLAGLEKLFPMSHIFGGYHQGWQDLTIPHEVDAITGAFFLTSRRVIDKVGLLDEQFFMYGEDIDWCWRIKQAGYRVMFHPAAKIIHFKKQSGRARQFDPHARKEAQRHFLDTMEQFYRKHYLKKYPAYVSALILSVLRVWRAMV